jgi:hypothetical protein
VKHFALAIACVTTIAAVAAQELAGKWVGDEQGRGNVTYPVALELVVKGSEVTGTVSVGEDPIKTVRDGKVDGDTITFTTPAMMNGREIGMTWRGTLKGGELTFVRQIGRAPAMPPLVLRRSPR